VLCPERLPLLLLEERDELPLRMLPEGREERELLRMLPEGREERELLRMLPEERWSLPLLLRALWFPDGREEPERFGSLR